jgi:large subunit ribosomal protein L18
MTISLLQKNKRAQQRARRTRGKITGTKERPRMSVYRSLQHISVQLIDDAAGQTLASASDVEAKAQGTKVEQAIAVGKLIADKAKKANITKVTFDRGSFKYHGRVKALADAAREGGLEF